MNFMTTSTNNKDWNDLWEIDEEYYEAFMTTSTNNKDWNTKMYAVSDKRLLISLTKL